jgi:hypothetical protein
LRINIPLIILLISLVGCDKLTKRIENFDLFGLDQAEKAIDQQNEKIRAAREYQATHSTTVPDASPPPSDILGNY